MLPEAQAVRPRGQPTIQDPSELWGGQGHCVASASVLSLSLDQIACDEPVSAVDVHVQGRGVKLLAGPQADERRASAGWTGNRGRCRRSGDGGGTAGVGAVAEVRVLCSGIFCRERSLDGAAVRDARDPRAHVAAARIELHGTRPHLQVAVLQHVLGRTATGDHTEDQSEDLRAGEVVQLGERALASRRDVRHQPGLHAGRIVRVAGREGAESHGSMLARGRPRPGGLARGRLAVVDRSPGTDVHPHERQASIPQHPRLVKDCTCHVAVSCV